MIILRTAFTVILLTNNPVFCQYHGPATSLLNNRIIGTPSVECMEDVVTLDFGSDAPFTGNIFVKGKSRDPSCTKSFSKLALTSTSYSLPLGRCGMQRLRSANPRGMSFTITFIISFHPIFLTEGDRAYHVRCFYMEPDEIVSAAIDVSMMATNTLTDRLSMPTCEYTVRRDSPNGAIVSFANIGETVYHVWECKGPDMGIMIKKCFVNDGRGDEVEVVDYDGCVVDLLLLGAVQYDSTLMRAHAQSRVFRYQDASELFFTCQIRMCQKNMGLCEGITPPKCSTRLDTYRSSTEKHKSSRGDSNSNPYSTTKEDSHYTVRRRRALQGIGLANIDLLDDTIDVMTPSMSIIGLEYKINASKADRLKSPVRGMDAAELQRLLEPGSVCLTSGWISVLVFFMLSTIVFCTLICVWLSKYNKLSKFRKQIFCGFSTPEP